MTPLTNYERYLYHQILFTVFMHCSSMFETEMMHQIWIYINIQIKYYNTNFHSDGLLDNDVREVPLF